MKTNNNKTWMKVALWTAGYGALSDSVIVPLLSSILEEFSDASETMRNLFVSGASAVMAMIFAMLTGVLMRHFSKRKLLILGTTLFAIGGIGGAFAHSMGFLLFTRMLDGMSDGIIMTTAASLVAQLFPDEKERSSFFSYNTVFSALFGMATASIAGVLCVRSWRLGFLANGLAFIPVILAILFIPETPLDKKEEPKTSQIGSNVKWNPLKPISIVILFFMLNSLANIAFFLTDIYVNENGLGNSALTGFASSFGIVFFLAAAMTFSFIYTKVKNQLPFSFCLMICLSYLILYYYRTPLGLFIAMAFLNFGQGIMTLYYKMQIVQNTVIERIGLMMGFYSATVYGSSLVGPFVPSWINKISIGDTASVTGSFVTVFIILAIATIAYIPLLVKRTKE